MPVDCIVVEEQKRMPVERQLVAEEPLTILVAEQPVATLMRTPGDETDLALGFLLTEGIVRSVNDVGTVSFCAQGTLGARNQVLVNLASGTTVARLPQHRRVFSSCSVCGAEMIEEVARGITPFSLPPARLSPDDIYAVAEAMHRGQDLFRRTGGAHAAALARLPLGPGSEVLVREDMGRHNALDKVVGMAARRGILAPGLSAAGSRASGLLLILSGRLSYEMVAKAARAGIGDVAAISAPSALAVGLGRSLNMFLAGFVRDRTMTVYSGADALQAADVGASGG